MTTPEPKPEEVLRKGRRAWNAWRKANPAAEVVIRNADLSGLDLGGADLSGVSLRDVRLNESELSGADLSGSKLDSVSLKGARLTDANLAGARLAWSELNEADLVRADLSGSCMDSVHFEKANLTHASFHGAKISFAFFEAANLEKADLSGARIDGADRRDANLRGARFDGASLRNVGVRHAELEEAAWTGAKLDGTLLSEGRFGAPPPPPPRTWNEVLDALNPTVGNPSEAGDALRLIFVVGDAVLLLFLAACVFVFGWFELRSQEFWPRAGVFAAALLAAALMQWRVKRRPLQAKMLAPLFALAVGSNLAAAAWLFAYVIPPGPVFNAMLVRFGAFPALCAFTAAGIGSAYYSRATALLAVCGGAVIAYPFFSGLDAPSELSSMIADILGFDPAPWLAAAFAIPFLLFGVRGLVIDYFAVVHRMRMKLPKSLMWCAAVALLHSYYRISLWFFLAFVTGSRNPEDSRSSE